MNSRIETLIDRDKPVVYIQGEDCIWRYDPYQNSVTVLLIGLRNPSGMWVAPTSDLLWLEDVKVTRPREAQQFTKRAVKCAAARDVLDYGREGELVPLQVRGVSMSPPITLCDRF